jgi:hypothetical protein
MNPVLAYFLGILTVILVIFPFWYVSTKDEGTRDVYDNIFCRKDF